ncbi:MAG TPA: protein-L-isoaspartate(D-aspartate) O-methyltransferase, partial [Thermoanaerobaculia bacterium]|nr:protein-L-isoaspartate(D-aspartate) O-methyltransferase [Thermoanaerobaculia bacterium]
MPATAIDFAIRRREMVDQQIARRGVRDPRVLEALATVPREAFVPEHLAEFAYDDTPLPIGEEQTISQPFIVALMAEALELQAGDRVLEIGAGSGYAAAVLSRLAGEVYAIERHASLAKQASRRLEELGYGNVRVHHGDGTLGWPEAAPYDAIVVAAGGPDVPPALVDQLAPGGRLVIPVGSDPRLQKLIRLRRGADGVDRREDLGDVRFVPLVGVQGWTESGRQAPVLSGLPEPPAVIAPAPAPPRELPALIREAAEPFGSIDSIGDASLDALLQRIGDARLVLLGEATHGTSEFYRMRARITRELVTRKGFNVVAVEADWPDAVQVDRWVRGRSAPGSHDRERRERAFARFPTWMWRNHDVRDFIHWLRDHNAGVADPARRVGFYGLDLYSLYSSIHAVTRYLDQVDPEAARIARLRYGCLTPWEQDPALYGQAALMGRYDSCEQGVVETLVKLLEKRVEYESLDGEHFLEAVQNARVAANAERYYRIMYYGSRDSWNLRDHHMFDTLESVLAFRGPESKAVVWAHNSHLGDARATQMGDVGELNVGQLMRQRHGDEVFSIGFSTHTGTVTAAHD